MLNKVINFVSSIFESEETKKQKREEQSKLNANIRYKVFKEVLNTSLPFIRVSESKNIRKEERQVGVTIPKSQSEQLKSVHGIDVDEMLENMLRNELISTIQKYYIEKMFAIGWESHFKIGTETQKSFNITLDPSQEIKNKSKKKIEEYIKSNLVSYNGYSKKLYENGQDGILTISRNLFNSSIGTNIQNRLLNNISDAIKELQNKNLPTRERKYRLFCNYQIGTAILDTISPSQQTGHPFKIGTILNDTVEVYINPYMSPTDNRVCVGYSDNKLIMAAEENLHTSFIHGEDNVKGILSLTYGIDYLGDFSDCITFDVYLGNSPTIY